MKIKTIEVKNFKAVSEQTVSFDGCSAIITAGNDKGKTSLLRGLIDRLRGEKPEIIVKEGEKNGFSIIELTDGSRIEWRFTEKSETFAFITKEGVKQTTGVIRMIGEKYFGIKFDIDKFLNSGPKDQTAELQKLIGIDFTEINQKYKEAYDERTIKNGILRDLRDQRTKPELIKKPNIEMLKEKLNDIKIGNDKIKETYKLRNKEYLQEIQEFNKEQRDIDVNYNAIAALWEKLSMFKETIFSDAINFDIVGKIMIGTKAPEKEKSLSNLPEPDYISVLEIEQKIEESNNQLRKYDAYERNLQDYNEWIIEGKNAAKNAEKADEKVKEIEEEKRKLISEANVPKEFEFTPDGILYKGLPLSNAQISSSGKYIAALKLGAMAIGECKTMHFDASFLDKNSLSKIQSWANDNDLQLLIERPDFEDGEIKYEII